MKNARLLAVVLAVSVMFIAVGCGQQKTEAPAAGFEEVESSLIGKVKYDAAAQTLTVAFESGNVYDYKNVPQRIYDDLMAAESKGKFFQANIKDKFEYSRQSQ